MSQARKSSFRPRKSRRITRACDRVHTRLCASSPQLPQRRREDAQLVDGDALDPHLACGSRFRSDGSDARVLEVRGMDRGLERGSLGPFCCGRRASSSRLRSRAFLADGLRGTLDRATAPLPARVNSRKPSGRYDFSSPRWSRPFPKGRFGSDRVYWGAPVTAFPPWRCVEAWERRGSGQTRRRGGATSPRRRRPGCSRRRTDW